MANSPRPLVAGNWKMNGLKASLAELSAMAKAYDEALQSKVDLLICPPSLWIAPAVSQLAGSALAIGAQDCHFLPQGAHTGDISALMIKDAGASHVIVGHSERRTDHGETSALVKSKAEAAIAAGLVAIVCVGETQAERQAGRANEVVGEQLQHSIPADGKAKTLVIAYEPVWAIGTGLTPTAADVADMHGFIRQTCEQLLPGQGQGLALLYGGSVKAQNAAELMHVANVNGALVGGASLKASDFMAIADVYR